jgi:hypothetical protein
MFAERLQEFVKREGLKDECVQELVQLFNQSLVEIGQYILNETKGKTTQPPTRETVKQEKPSQTTQRWASKVAQAFAEEKELTLDDFPGVEKVTKQHMLDHLKQNNKKEGAGSKPRKVVDPPKPVKSSQPPTPTDASSSKQQKKVICSGFTKGGDPCNRTGTVTPDGAKNCYCFRHADQWRDFECEVSSDSDLEEEDEPPSSGIPTPPHDSDAHLFGEDEKEDKEEDSDLDEEPLVE